MFMNKLSNKYFIFCLKDLLLSFYKLIKIQVNYLIYFANNNNNSKTKQLRSELLVVNCI